MLFVLALFAGGCSRLRCGATASAIRGGDDARALSLIAAGVSPSCHSGPEGYTLLHVAAVAGQVAVVDALLDHGAVVDAPSTVQKTAFYEACKHGQLATAQRLLDRGAAVDEPNGEKGARPLSVAAEQHHGDIVAMLLAHGADVSARGRLDQTVLHQVSWQAWHDDAEMARVLVDHGAQLEVHDRRGWTPLTFAAMACHGPVVQYLVEQGANIDAHSDPGGTPLDVARSHHCADVERYLVAHRARGSREL